MSALWKTYFVTHKLCCNVSNEDFSFRNKELEASDIKTCEIVHEYIDRLYFELIKFHNYIFNTLKLLFENVVMNGLKSHKKDKKTVFDILGVCYKRTSRRTKVAA
jgi:hypothetical protein